MKDRMRSYLSSLNRHVSDLPQRIADVGERHLVNQDPVERRYMLAHKDFLLEKLKRGETVTDDGGTMTLQAGAREPAATDAAVTAALEAVADQALKEKDYSDLAWAATGLLKLGRAEDRLTDDGRTMTTEEVMNKIKEIGRTYAPTPGPGERGTISGPSLGGGRKRRRRTKRSRTKRKGSKKRSRRTRKRR